MLAPLAGGLPRPELVWVDRGYNGADFAAWVAGALGRRVEVVQRPDAGQWHVWPPAEASPPPPRPRGWRRLLRRWLVERTFAWLGRNRRLANDHEGLRGTGEARIDLATIRLLARRLAA